jgi:D-aminopeptidase
VAERWREIAGPVGRLEPGPRDAITDVPGVRAGHAPAASGERTGVTVVAPPLLPALAGIATVNGVGELTAKLEIEERGVIETPVYLCGSHAVGTVFHAGVLASGRGPDDVVLPVVGECNDGPMADSRTVAVADVDGALEALGSDVAEGSVGAGTGMTCFGFPGGIGTASRTVGEHRIGVLLLCNFGDREYLDLLGSRLDAPPAPPGTHGSCIAVCATDAPLAPHQLRRLALRPLLGLARAGSYAAEGSGEIGLAFSTSTDASLPNERLNPYFAAAYEAAHEAVYNCLVAARPARRRDGSMQDGFPIELVRELATARSAGGDEAGRGQAREP